MESKTIIYRGGLIEFEVPEHWVEEYGEEGATFYEDREDSGTFRLNIVTLEAPGNVAKDRTVEALRTLSASQKGDVLKLENDNAVLRYSDTMTTEEGKEITIFYWMIASPVGERYVRVGDFSYTVLVSKLNTEQTKGEIHFLEDAVFNSRFHPGLAT